MESEYPQKYYQIGDFAKYMGVTPDFLKHYEANGLLDVQQAENGYRHYPFNQSAQILEYMRLRNYGVSVREMRGFLCADDDEGVKRLDEKAAQLRRQAERMLAIADEHARVKAWLAKRREKPVDWEVREAAPQLFLPHTNEQDFIKDERIYALLKQWADWMPIAKSALRISPLSDEARAGAPKDVRYGTSWGMILPAPVAERHRIPVNDVLESVPGAKVFIYHFVGMEALFNIERISRGDHPMFGAMAKLGLKPAGDFFLVVEMKLTMPDGRRRGGSGRFVVPVAD